MEEHDILSDTPPPLPKRQPMQGDVEKDKSNSLASKPNVNDLLDNFDSPPPLPERQPSPRISTPQMNPLDTLAQQPSSAPNLPQAQPTTSLSPNSIPGSTTTSKSSSAPVYSPNSSRLTTAGSSSSSLLSEKTKEELSFDFDRHVQEIRRRRTVEKKPMKPDVKQYTTIESESGKKVVDFPLYIKAHVIYYYELLARDDNVRKLEPLQWKRAKGLLSRLYDASGPSQSLGLYVERVMLWTNPAETFLWFVLYFTLWYYGLWIPSFLLLFTIKILNNRYGFLGDFKGMLNVPTNLIQSNHNNNHQTKKKSKIRSQLRELVLSKDMSDWVSQLTKIWGPYGMALLEENVCYLERVKNLFRWERPAQTWRVIALLSFYIFVSTFFQWMVLPAIGFAIGAEYFILLPIQHHFPRHSYLFSPIEWILWGVPTEADLVIERLTKQHNEPKAPKVEISGPTENTIEPGEDEEEIDHDSGSIYSVSSGYSPARIIKNEYHKRASRKSPLSSPNLSESTNDSEQSAQDKNEFHCMLRGKPGKLVITENTLQFRPNKLLGRESEIIINWEDIDSIKKSKTMNIGPWSMPGIEVSDTDGQVTSFQSVVKRDDAFRKLVLTSGKKWNNV